MEFIESAENRKVREWAGLKEKKQRQKDRSFLFESERGIGEAIGYGFKPKALLIREDREIPSAIEKGLEGVPIFRLSTKAFGKVSGTENSQGVIGVFPFKEDRLSDLLKDGRLLFLDGLQDPGNLGTIVRSAAAFGAGGLILGPGCVDLYNEKVLRSTLGGLFALPIVQGDHGDLSLFQKHGFSIFGSDLQGTDLEEQAFPPRTIVGIGNENQGLVEGFRSRCEGFITIPLKSSMESLNAAIAAGIILYKFNR